MRSKVVVPIVLLVSAAAGLGAAWFKRWPGSLSVGPSLEAARSEGVTLHPGEPVHIRLELRKPRDQGGQADAELYHDAWVVRRLPVPVKAGEREIVISFDDVADLVGALRGPFRLDVAEGPRLLGRASFTVSGEAGAPRPPGSR